MVARKVIYTPAKFPQNFVLVHTDALEENVVEVEKDGKKAVVWKKAPLRTWETGCGARRRYKLYTSFLVRGKFYEQDLKEHGLLYFEKISENEYKAMPLSRATNVEAMLIVIGNYANSRVKEAKVVVKTDTEYGYVSAGSVCTIESDTMVMGFWPTNKIAIFAKNRPAYRDDYQEWYYYYYQYDPKEKKVKRWMSEDYFNPLLLL